jgi:hypothetical protein
MLEQTYEATADNLSRSSNRMTSNNTNVWRDGVLGLAASVGVGILTGSALTAVVFSLVAISIGH